MGASSRCASSTASKSSRSVASGVPPSPMVTIGVKVDAGVAHHGEAPIEDRLFQFELRDAVAQEPADGVAAFEDLDVVTRAAQAARRRRVRPVPNRRRRRDGRVSDGGSCADVEAAGEGVFGDLVLDALDGDRVGSEMPKTQADSHGAGQSRPVNSGKVVGVEELLGGLLPASRGRRGR